MKNAVISFAVMFVASLLSAPVQSQDKPEKAPPKADGKKSSSDDEFLKELVPDIPLGGKKKGEDGQAADVDELDRTVKAMRQVGKKIDEGDTSDETRDLQAGILDDIDALIEKLKNPPPQQQSKPNQKPPQDQTQNPQQQPQNPGQKPNSQPKTPSGQQSQSKPGSEQSGSGGGKTSQKNENKEAGESTEDARQKAQARATALARRRALINEFWGHLRPSVREKLLNVGSDKMLPHYEELIRRYYESLTDSGQKPN